MKAALAAACVGLATFTLRAEPVDQQPYRGGTHLVSIFATVTDDNHRLIPGLGRDDFAVYDNGKRQPLSVFSNDTQPITIVVMLDRSGSMSERFDLVDRATEQFILKLNGSDRARLGNFADRILISPSDFTSDHKELLNVLRRGMQDIGASPVWGAVDRSVAALRNQRGSRVVLVFTDGHDSPNRGQPQLPLATVIQHAQLDDVMVYAIGLTVPDDAGFLANIQRGRGRVPFIHQKVKMLKPDPGLRRLADATGGGYFELQWTDNLTSTFGRVAEELHRQYWLGFAPQKLDGKVHRLEVKVKRSGLTVRARPSYVASMQ